MAHPPTAEDILNLQRANRLPEAEAACRQALAANPSDPRLLLVSGNIALAIGDQAKGRERLRALAGMVKAAPELRHHAALLLRKSGDMANAVDALRSLAAQYPQAFPVLLELGQTEEALGRPKAALQAYDAAIALNPGHAGPFTRRAVLQLRQTFGDPLAAPADKQQADNSRGRVTMSSLGWNGRFGNQLLQYGFLRALGQAQGLTVEAPEWIGRWLYDLDDPYPRAPLPELREKGDNLARLLDGSERDATAANKDLWGYCCYHTRHYRPHRDLVRRLFVPGERFTPLATAAMAKVMARGRTLVALHLRRGDFGYSRFWIAPETWYLDWLRALWPQLDAPVLFIASDDPEIYRQFADYAPLTAADLGPAIPGAEFFLDFHVLSQADHLAISNSSFSFVAAMLDARGRSFMRPDLTARRLIPFDPWDAEVLLPDPNAPSQES